MLIIFVISVIQAVESGGARQIPVVQTNQPAIKQSSQKDKTERMET